jgi:hypothetical protein
MRYLGLIAALVLIVCGVTYYTREPVVGPNGQPLGTERYSSAINAARGASKFVDAEKRRRWAVSMQSNDYENPQGGQSQYSTAGENSEILVVTSISMDNFRCASIASGSIGTAAAREGFTKLSCRNRSNDLVFDADLKAGE